MNDDPAPISRGTYVPGREVEMSPVVNALAGDTADRTRARAIELLIVDSERQLRIGVQPDVHFLRRMDTILSRALSGGLDSRRYHAVYTIRRYWKSSVA